ncbi:ganglioside GM2 activator [Opisthocomus hoazin]|uniref:ganglioside GM2 activator n=1 Tax=Opisthocomus hoazin TaxID=30419 RepID=UPI003F53409F
MLGAGLALALCALQLCPAALGGSRSPVLVERSRSRRVIELVEFAWENCGDETDPVVVKSLTVAPDPITIPGTLTLSGTVSCGETISSPLKAVLTVEKQLGSVWIQLPCIDQLGSCTYDDVCTLLDDAIPPGTSCPEPLLTYGIPCHCPFQEGSYSLPESNIELPEVELPSWLTNGNYRVQAVISSDGNQLACMKVTFSLQS